MVKIINLTNYIVKINRKYTLYPNNSRLDSKILLNKKIFEIRLMKRENHKCQFTVPFKQYKDHIYISKKFEEHMLEWSPC